MRRHSLLTDCVVISFLIFLNLLVIFPFLTMDFSTEPWNNDYTYIGMSRMFHDRPWTWNSLQYGGAPFRYLYPPLFHVLVSAIPVKSLGRAYHIVSGIGYALVPAAFYIAAIQLFRSRKLAAILAAVQSFSPSVLYYLVPSFGGFAAAYRHGPWNFVALVASNESAHTLSLALVLLALAAAWRDRWFAASLLAGTVFLTNWAGIIGLLMVLAATGIARSRDLGFWKAILRVGSVAGIGYGLAAFWVSPDTIFTTKLLDRVVLRHIQLSTPWSATTGWILAAALVLLAFSLWRRVNAAAAFALALLAIAGAVVISYDRTGNYLLPLPHRYLQEFNVAIVLAIGCLASLAWRWRRPAGVAILALSALPAIPFLAGAWTVQQRSVDPHTTNAFQIADWFAHHAGESRVMAIGELEGSLNIWSNVRQVGGSAQGISNYLLPAAQRQIALGCGDPQATTRIAELWLRALDVRYLLVHGPESPEHFHWFVQPERFASWPAVWNNGKGDTIYQLPPPEEQSAVVVDLAQLKGLAPLRATDDAHFLEAYVPWARGKRNAPVKWLAPDRAEIQADTGPNEAVLLKMNHDPGWEVSSGETGRDPVGFLLLRGPFRGPIRLHFGASGNVWLGRAITVVTILLLLLHVPSWIVAALALAPALCAYGILQLHAPPSAVIAEQAYSRLQPPLINPAAIVDGVTMAQPPPGSRQHRLCFRNRFWLAFRWCAGLDRPAPGRDPVSRPKPNKLTPSRRCGATRIRHRGSEWLPRQFFRRANALKTSRHDERDIVGRRRSRGEIRQRLSHRLNDVVRALLAVGNQHLGKSFVAEFFVLRIGRFRHAIAVDRQGIARLEFGPIFGVVRNR